MVGGFAAAGGVQVHCEGIQRSLFCVHCRFLIINTRDKSVCVYFAFANLKQMPAEMILAVTAVFLPPACSATRLICNFPAPALLPREQVFYAGRPAGRPHHISS